MARGIPPLNPLHVFVVAARAGNFTAASELLRVTPSAVSRQIAVLEGFLETRLFHRGVHANTLSDVGERYFQEISPAFEAIEAATSHVHESRGAEPLKLRVPATFGMRFLIPRLRKFRAEHPNIPVRMDTGYAAVDFTREEVEVSIQTGNGVWPGTESKFLFASWIQPMCGPKLLTQNKPIKTIEDLFAYPLLYSKNRPNDWHDWLTAKGMGDRSLKGAELIEFSNSLLMYQAAEDGLGITLGQLPLLGRDLSASRLMPLFGPPVVSASYYAVWRANAGPSRRARTFMTWLEREIAATLAPEDVASTGQMTKTHDHVPTVKLRQV